MTEQLKFTIPGAPVGKPRQTRQDIWKKRPRVLRYRSWADTAREHCTLPAGCHALRMVFYMPMPESWSDAKRTRMNLKPHQQKPDIDNLQKSVLDALLTSDQGVYHVEATKYWAHEGTTNITVLISEAA